MTHRSSLLPTVIVALSMISPVAVRGQQLEDLIPTEAPPSERPPAPLTNAFPEPADLPDALNKAVEAIRVAERRGADMMEKLQETEFYVRAAQELAPGNLRVEFISGRMNVLIGRRREALAQVRAYVKSAEGASDWEALKILGDLYLDSKYYVQAAEKYGQAFDLHPAEVSALVGLSECALARGQKGDAVSFAFQATQVNSASPEAWDAYTVATQSAGQYEDALVSSGNAITLTQTALRKNSTDTALANQLFGRLKTRMGILEVRHRISVASNEDPASQAEILLDYVHTSRARTEIARLLAFHELWAMLDNAMEELEPNPPADVVYSFVDLSLIIEQYDRADEVLRMRLAADPNDARAADLLQQIQAAQAAIEPPKNP